MAKIIRCDKNPQEVVKNIYWVADQIGPVTLELTGMEVLALRCLVGSALGAGPLRQASDEVHEQLCSITDAFLINKSFFASGNLRFEERRQMDFRVNS